MKKVNVALVCAGLMIAGIMVYLMVTGVQLKERRMVKWSNVSSGEEAGRKIGRFFFPIIQEKQKIQVVGKGIFAAQFFRGFSTAAQAHSPKATVTMARDEKNASGFVLTLSALQNADDQDRCGREQSLACVKKKALNQFNKKSRSKGLYWINMYRLSENEAILFFIKK